MELTDKIRRVYLPMTETGFLYLVLSTKGTSWLQYYTKGQGDDRFASFDQSWNYVWDLVKDGKDGLIFFVREEEKRKIYQITDLGRKVLDIELKRIERLYRNSREEG